MELLIRLQKDRDLTLIVCSASLSDAGLLCERFTVFDAGRVVVDGPVLEVLGEAGRLAELDITLPEPVLCAREPGKLFPELPSAVLTEDELEAEVLKRLGVL